MTYFTLWKRIGKQLIRDIQDKQAVVFIENEEYAIKRIRYKNGIINGFEAVPKKIYKTSVLSDNKKDVERKFYSSEELLKMGKEKNNMDFAENKEKTGGI